MTDPREEIAAELDALALTARLRQALRQVDELYERYTLWNQERYELWQEHEK